MKHMLKKIVSLILCLSLISSFLCCYAAADTAGNRVTLSSDKNILTIETTEGDVIQVETEEVEDAYILRQYTNGELVDEVRLDRNYILRNDVLQARARTYVGQANYRAGFYGMDYEYDISVKVYRSTSIEESEVYKPTNGNLTVAAFIADAASVLSIPIGFLNAAAGAILAGVSFIGGKYISWEQSKIPALVCTAYHYDYDLYHYGNAPIYNEGECINRTGTKYVVDNTNDQSEYKGDIYYEGLIVESKNTKAADDIYHALYTFTPYEFVDWS